MGAAVTNSPIEPGRRRRGAVPGRGPEPSACIRVHLWFHLFLAGSETVGVWGVSGSARMEPQMRTDAHKWVSKVDPTWETTKQDKRDNSAAFKPVFVLPDSRIAIRDNLTGPSEAGGGAIIPI
jgi:hypothetical protein